MFDGGDKDSDGSGCQIAWIGTWAKYHDGRDGLFSTNIDQLLFSLFPGLDFTPH